MSLYNKMRPMFLSDVKGQDKTIKILKENLTSGHLPNAMLFVGTRGTGKTTVAKIVAKQLNCESPLPDGSCCDKCSSCKAIKDGSYLDVLELDAASNNGVDNIRDIIESVQFKPIGKKKVIILDEVHMLSTGAFNALLKIMEEPPSYVLFILCTTELHKIPATILSRCRKFQFETISIDLIISKLQEINSLYGIEAEDAALMLVAKAANGSMRDAESIYENFLDVDGKVTERLVIETLGYTNEDSVFAVLDGIVTGDPTISFSAIQQTLESGGSLVYLMEECFRILMDVISIHMGGDISRLTSSRSKEYIDKISNIAFSLSTERLFEISDSLKAAYEKKSGNMELILQSMIISLVCRQGIISNLLTRIETLENKLNSMCAGTHIVPEDSSEEIVPEKESSNEISDMESNDKAENDFVPDEAARNSSDFPDDMLADLAAAGFAPASEDVFDESVDAPAEHPANESVVKTKNLACDFFGDYARLFDGL